MKIVEGSYAIAHAVKACRVNVISAYPITPQTHIVEYLAQFVGNRELEAEFLNVESEHSALSTCIGASSTGARSFSATSSQGLILMAEVLFNASGMRLPMVLVNANRSISAPLSIWNDQQDSLSIRDCGWIQFYAEDCQEAHDLVIMAYKIAEDRDILLPVMICVDGYILTHVYEPVELASQEQVDSFLPPYEPEFYLTPRKPYTFGPLVGPEEWMEVRYMQFKAMERARDKIREVTKKFKEVFGRDYEGLTQEYGKNVDVDILLISMGSLIGTMKDVLDEVENVRILKIRSLRPFPIDEIRAAAEGAKVIAVLEKAISIGFEGNLFSEVKASLYNNAENKPPIIGFTVGLSSRDVTKDMIRNIIRKAKSVMEKGMEKESEWIGLREELLT